MGITVSLAAALLLAACTAATPEPSPTPAPTALASGNAVPLGSGTDLATGLAAPWSMVPLADGTSLVSERDSGRVLEVAADGAKRTVGTVPGVVHSGEGGLLGLAVHVGSCPGPEQMDPNNPCFDLFAYLTTAEDNRVVRMPLLGEGGNRALGPAIPIITGIPKAANHNGGRIAFGPDGLLYAGTGDAGNGANAQDPTSLGGKILRTTPDGNVPTGNPFPGSPVWSVGHRNVQGIAWDSRGRMWASEFGQNTWDELNEIRPGRNYGWPVVEGIGTDTRFTNPVLQWPTDQASPSGIAIDGTTLYMAALRGERLWVVDLAGTPAARAFLTGTFGRLRDVAVTPDGRLRVLTNNTDGRGTLKDGDDRIVAIPLE
ncbi:MAG: PQQ-dependent sugar dehydrogenase [Specibacter sp.]